MTDLAQQPGAAQERELDAHGFARVLVENNRKRPVHEQEKVHFMAVCDLLNSRTSKQLRDVSLRCCQDFQLRGIGCSNPTTDGRPGAELQLLVQFLGFEWPESHLEEIEQLFRGYIRASMMPVDAPLLEISRAGEFVQAPSSLEYAVTQGKTRLMVALIEEGADYTVVPKEFHLRLAAGGPVLAGQGEFLDFIKHQTHLPAADVTAMHAAATSAVMRRRITELRDERPDDIPAPAPLRTRRAGL